MRCYVCAYEHIAAARGHAFNIGGGMENSMSPAGAAALPRSSASASSSTTPICPGGSSDQKFFVADNGKALRLLGWAPRTTREEGLETVLAWESRAAGTAEIKR